MSKAREFYQSLNPQQKEFVDQKTISTSVTVKHWLLFLNKATAYDQHIDKLMSRSWIWTFVFTALMIGSAIAAGANENANFLYGTLAAAIILTLVVINHYKLKKKDLHNYLREFFMPFLEVMKIKAGEEAKLSASLDFRDPTKVLDPTKYRETEPRKRSIQLYQPKFIIAKISLLDQCYLETVIADDIKVISYRNPRGKYKSKKKTVHHYFIKLTVSKSVYRLKSGSPPPEIEVSEDESEYVLKFKGKVKEPGETILQRETYFIGLQRLYDMLEPVNAPPAAVAEKPSGSDGDSSGDALSSSSLGPGTIPAMIWADSYFKTHDYDSTRNRGEVPLMVEDESTANMFDS